MKKTDVDRCNHNASQKPQKRKRRKEIVSEVKDALLRVAYPQALHVRYSGHEWIPSSKKATSVHDGAFAFSFFFLLFARERIRVLLEKREQEARHREDPTRAEENGKMRKEAHGS